MASEPIGFASKALRPNDADEVIPLTVPTVVAFLGRAERGPVNEAVSIESFDDFRRVFGDHGELGFVSFAVQHFFLHGGERAIVVRIANGATRALLEIPAGPDALRLQARQPGSREILRASVDYDRVGRSQDRFNLVIQRLARPDSQLVEDQEVFEGLSMDATDDRFVVDMLMQSALVRLIGPLPIMRPDATRAARPGEPIPYIAATRPGSDGDEITDYDVIGSSSEGTGLFALDRCEQVDLVCVPSPPERDLGTAGFVAAARYCERRRALLIWDPPWSWSSTGAAVFGARASERMSRYVVTYFPRVRPRGDQTRRHDRGMPACGVVAGVLARCDREGVWHRMPAQGAGLKGNLAPVVDLSAREALALNRAGINAFVRVHPGAPVLQGDASFASHAAVARRWQKLGASRLISFVIRSIEKHTRWVYAAENPDDLPADLERQVWIFLSRLHERGALAGKTPEQAFFVRAGAAVAALRGGIAVTLRVGFAPERPNELVTYDFKYCTTGKAAEIATIVDAESRLA